MKIRYTLPLLLISSVLVSPATLATEIRAGLSRNPVNLNESFQLTLTADEQPDGNPDLQPLRENFDIINQQRSSSSSWIDGKSTRSEQWIINLMPKHSGEILIPPISFGTDQSQPLKISVTDNPQPAASNNAELFLQVEATPQKPYVQSQVLYTLKLFRRVQITQASLNEPELKDAVVEKLGEDNTYSTQINHVDYWVTERKYAIFPQQSGELTIPALTLNAEVISQQQPRFNGFFNRQISEHQRISSKAITLQVQEVPASFKDAAWLSAEALELTESWSDNTMQTQVGEPLTRSIKLTAKGATVGQLPELAGQTSLDGLKTYPDQPLLKEDKAADGLTALREEKIAFIPSKPGQYNLPAQEIKWFNTRNNRLEIATLPAATINAIAASNAPAAAVTKPSLPAVTDSQSPVATTASPHNNQVSAEPGFWPWLAAALGLGWLLTLLWFKRPRLDKSIADTKTKTVQSAKNASEAVKALKQACRDNNPHAAKQALLAWGRQQWAVDNLTALAAASQPELATAILSLNQHLYAAQQVDWQGADLWQAFENRPAANAAKADNDEQLPPLFKL